MSRPSGSSTLEAGAVRTYHGRTVEDLIPKIQDDLGPDAIIVHRREGLTGGVAGFFQRPYVEIDAIPGGPRVDVYDEEPLPPIPAATAPPTRAPQQSAALGQSAPQGQSAALGQPAHTPPRQATRTPFYEREPHGGTAGRYVTGHLAELAQSSAAKAAVSEGHELSTRPQAQAEAADQFARVLERATSEESAAPTPQPASPPRNPTPPTRSRARVNVQSRLVSLGTSPSFAEETIEVALAHVVALAPRTPLGKAVGQALAQRIPVAPPLPAQGAAIVLVGPGGAGKTSCCAALLAAYRANSTLRASYATIVRGHGNEWQLLLSPQLRKPIAADSDRAKRALRKAKAQGLLVIDTPPLSAGESGAVRQLGALLGAFQPERVTIALPATLGAVAASQLLRALSPLGANALALTHADETDQVGVAVEAACEFGLAPEYTLDRGRRGGWKLRRIDPTGLAATLLP
jgi:flagellar biosynthesis GTPase FlhF